MASGHPRLGLMLSNIALISTCAAEATGDLELFARARASFERALRILEPVYGAEHPNVGGVLMNYGLLEAKRGELERAVGYYERALEIFEGALGLEHPSVKLAVDNLGLVALERGDDERARHYYERSLTIGEATLGPDHPQVANTLSELGGIARRAGELPAARAYFERVLAIYSERPAGDETYARVHVSLAAVTWELAASAEQRARARGLAERARELYVALGQDEDVREIDAWLHERRSEPR